MRHQSQLYLRLDLRQAEKQGPLSKRFGMSIHDFISLILQREYLWSMSADS